MKRMNNAFSHHTILRICQLNMRLFKWYKILQLMKFPLTKVGKIVLNYCKIKNYNAQALTNSRKLKSYQASSWITKTWN